MINSRTRVFALFGDPVSHSLSPLMQNYFMRRFGVDGIYVAMPVSSNQLQPAIQGAAAMKFAGVNLTTPHKQAVLPLCQQQSPECRLIGAANTLVFRENNIHAYTTDAFGFITSLGEAQARFKDSRVVLWGAGGAARSICLALSQLGVGHLTIVNRTQSRGQELASFCTAHLAFQSVNLLVGDHPLLADTVDAADILINSTSIGLHPQVEAAPFTQSERVGRKHFVYDLIYNPRQTRFLVEAEKRGAVVQNGLDMLIYQGLAALNIWLESDFSLDKKMYHELVAKMNAELG